MNKVSKLGQLADFVLYVTLQLCVAQFVFLDRSVLCFVYVAFLLLLPSQQAGLPLILLISFSVGLLVDLFYHSMGVHAFASVLMAYSRAIVLQFMLPTSSYDVATRPTPSTLGWKLFSLFSLILIGMHHIVLFFLEAGSLMPFFVIMRKAILSTLLTFAFVLATQGILFLVKRS